jgi:multicomponent Na+:H+ antiporter subunit E
LTRWRTLRASNAVDIREAAAITGWRLLVLGVTMRADWRVKLGWTAALFLLWLIVCAIFHYQTVLVGLGVAFLIASLNSDLLPSLSADLHVTPRTIIPWIKYSGYLVIEIIKASMQVARLAFTRDCCGRMISDYVEHESLLREPMMRVFLANSITLTPGTLTVEAPLEGPLLVHVLTREAADGLKDWTIERQLAVIERKI